MKKSISFFLLLSINCFAKDTESTLRTIREQVKFVEFSFTDFLGNRKSVIRPIQFLEEDLKYGIFVDGSSLKGCKRIWESDLKLIPHPETARIIPWTNNQATMATIMCDLFVSDNEPYQSDPRFILQKTIAEADKLGYKFVAGTELEFYAFELDQSQKPIIPKNPNNISYIAADDNCITPNIVGTILTMLELFDLDPQKYHREVSEPQYEVVLSHDFALEIADKITLAKHALKALYKNYNLNVSFMPKPVFGQNGNGMHIHFSLVDNQTNKNVFYQAEDEYYLSPVAKSFIAGVLTHAREMALLFNQTVNSYKRLIPGFEAPVYICCGTQNRSALIRIPQINIGQENAARAEIRCPDPLCNPYLALAVLLKAGLDGIRKEMNLDQFVNENLFELDVQTVRSKGIEILPSSLEEAIAVFEQSDFMQELLGNHLFNTYIQEKKQEVQAYKQAVTDWELDTYF